MVVVMCLQDTVLKSKYGYMWQNGKDSFYRITNKPSRRVFSGKLPLMVVIQLRIEVQNLKQDTEDIASTYEKTSK